MSKGQMLRELVNQRLNAAAEEIFGLFEKTIAEYEEEHERQKRQLEAVFQPQLRLHRTGIQQLSVSKAERTSEPLELSSSLDKENPPEPPHIKEEGMELWSSQKGEKHQKLEEVQFTGVVVKEEDDEEKPQSSHFYQKQTEGSKTVSDGEYYGGPDLDQTADLSEAETENSDDNWMVASESQLGLNSTGNNEVSQSDVGCENGTTRQLCCSKCGKIFTQMSLLKVHIRTHTVEKPFSCSICGKRFTQRGSLQCHLSTHTGEKPFSCKICNKTFGRRGTLWKHTKRHTGEKPFSCPLCSKSFLWNSVLQLHMRTHTGHPTQSRTEQLLNSIIDGNSEVEDLSDGDTTDPRFEPDAPSEEDPPDSSESEQQSSDSESQAGAKGKRKHEDTEGFSGLGGDAIDGHWLDGAFTPEVVQFQDQGDIKVLSVERHRWQPLDYVEQYIDLELMKLITDCTNTMSMVNTGRSLQTTVNEIFHFFGASILMSCVPYPQIKMFWSNALRVPAISDKINRDRYFKLRKHLKVVVDNDISENLKKTDSFWKTRPFMDRILKGCLLQARPECVSIEEQMIPFTGACPFRQHVPLKPNPVGMKNFVLASACGLVFDFEVYQGVSALKSQVYPAEQLDLGALVIKRLVRTLPPGTKVYYDRFITTVKVIEQMVLLEKQVNLTSRDQNEDPEESCHQRSKKDKQFMMVRRPAVVHENNSKMGCVDLVKRTISYYRMKVRTKKWTLRMLMHFTDLALANSWLLYRQDQVRYRTQSRDVMKFFEFRMAVAQAYLAKCDTDVQDVHQGGSKAHGKKCHVTVVPHISVRTIAAKHLPEVVNLKNPMRCREKGCSRKSRVRCGTCGVFLCLQAERNCFAAFHTRG